MIITSSMLRKVLPTLDDLQFSVLLRTVLGIKTDEAAANLPHDVVLSAAVYEWLNHLGMLTDSQCRLVLDCATPMLKQVSTLWCDGRRSAPGYAKAILVIVESRYAGCLTTERWLDFVYEEGVDELPTEAVTSISCNTEALMQRVMGWLQQLGGQDDQHQHHAGDGRSE